ncbi:hypothetical protein D3C79_760770 [compost metagenome]
MPTEIIIVVADRQSPLSGGFYPAIDVVLMPSDDAVGLDTLLQAIIHRAEVSTRLLRTIAQVVPVFGDQLVGEVVVITAIAVGVAGVGPASAHVIECKYVAIFPDLGEGRLRGQRHLVVEAGRNSGGTDVLPGLGFALVVAQVLGTWAGAGEAQAVETIEVAQADFADGLVVVARGHADAVGQLCVGRQCIRAFDAGAIRQQGADQAAPGVVAVRGGVVALICLAYAASQAIICVGSKRARYAFGIKHERTLRFFEQVLPGLQAVAGLRGCARADLKPASDQRAIRMFAAAKRVEEFILA